MAQKECRSLMQKVNGLDFYCEIRGDGPTIALIPSGEGDCGSFSKVADMLANEFTVFTLDMRGMSRSERPADLGLITAQILASDIAELLKALELVPASLYRCSSGGICVLNMGMQYPEVCRNLMIHEAAVLHNGQPGGAENFINRIDTAIKNGVTTKNDFNVNTIIGQVGKEAYERKYI